MKEIEEIRIVYKCDNCSAIQVYKDHFNKCDNCNKEVCIRCIHLGYKPDKLCHDCYIENTYKTQ